MNERVAGLREQSVRTKPFISTERAELVTQFYQSDVPMRRSVPVCRALAFKHIMENKTICINDCELIVGERGHAPKATPTYPELCLDRFEIPPPIFARKPLQPHYNSRIQYLPILSTCSFYKFFHNRYF